MTWQQGLTLIGLPVAGAILLHLWTRFRGRLARLFWSAQHTPMALSTEDLGFGQVQVLYNGQPTVNLHVTQVLLRNTSTKDLTDLHAHLAYLEGTRILRSIGFIPGGLEALPHADNFDQLLTTAVAQQASAAQIDYLLRNHEYRIPVLNRGSAVQFGLLVTRDDHSRPTISLDVTHPGVRLEYREPGTDIFGVRRAHAQIAGLVFGSLTALAVIALGASSFVSGLTGWLLGAFLLALGALVVKVIRGVSGLLS